MKVNINDYVKVKLTIFGLKIMKDKHDSLFKEVPERAKQEFKLPEIDSDGFSKFQIHELMSIFGDFMPFFATNEMPFQTEMEIETSV